MAPLATLLVVIVAAAILPAEVRGQVMDKDVASDAQAVYKSGTLLLDTLQKQWTDLDTFLHASYEGAIAAEISAESDEKIRTAIKDSIAELRRLVRASFNADAAFKKSQVESVTALVNKYISLIQQRIKSGSKDAGDEDGILALRKEKRDLFVMMEVEYLGMLANSRNRFRTAYHTISCRVEQHGVVQQHLRLSAYRMLLHLVNNQKKCMGILTGQMALIEKFTLDADNVLWRIAVPAQASVL